MNHKEAMDRYQLMIPGPIHISPEVLEEMARPIVPHYGPEIGRRRTITRQLVCFRTSLAHQVTSS